MQYTDIFPSLIFNISGVVLLYIKRLCTFFVFLRVQGPSLDYAGTVFSVQEFLVFSHSDILKTTSVIARKEMEALWRRQTCMNFFEALLLS